MCNYKINYCIWYHYSNVNKDFSQSSLKVVSLKSVFCVMHLPALVMIISVPISWNRFHKSEPCKSTRISSPELVPDCARCCAGCGLSNNTSSDSAEKDRKSLP